MKQELNFYDEDGRLKSKESFLKEVEQIYNEITTEEKASSFDSFATDLIDTERTLKSYNFSDRIIYLNKEITEETGSEIFNIIHFYNKVDNLDNIEKENREPIKIIIDTPGGNLTSAFTIIDAIKMSKTPIYTITIGCGYSAGFFIGISGHKRYGLLNSSYLFHQGSSCWAADANNFIQHTEFYQKILSKLKDFTLSQTNITEQEYKNYMSGDWWLTADEAKEKGVIDQIITEMF